MKTKFIVFLGILICIALICIAFVTRCSKKKTPNASSSSTRAAESQSSKQFRVKLGKGADLLQLGYEKSGSLAPCFPEDVLAVIHKELNERVELVAVDQVELREMQSSTNGKMRYWGFTTGKSPTLLLLGQPKGTIPGSKLGVGWKDMQYEYQVEPYPEDFVLLRDPGTFDNKNERKEFKVYFTISFSGQSYYIQPHQPREYHWTLLFGVEAHEPGTTWSSQWWKRMDQGN